MNNQNATAQAISGAGRGGVVPPKERQFGQPNGNPRNPGGWRREDTARYKLEQMLKLTDAELTEIANNPEAPLFERRIATSLIKEKDFKTTAAIINQVYGMPKQSVETIDLTPPKPLSPRKQNDKSQSKPIL